MLDRLLDRCRSEKAETLRLAQRFDQELALWWLAGDGAHANLTKG